MLSIFIAYYVLYFLSSDESDLLDDESEELGSDSRYSGTYSFRAFSLRFDDSAVSFLGSDVFHQQESIPKVFNSLHFFGAQVSGFLSKFQN